MMPTRPRLRLLSTVSLCLLGGAAFADDAVPGASKHDPVVLSAKEVTYDEPGAIATATGQVEVVQGDTILLADKVTYNQNTNVVRATGHVSVLEPTGDVFFADDAELRNDMQKGVTRQFRARLKDNSLFAAREGRKLNKQVTVMKDVVYSPCRVCTSGQSASSPLWQMEATKTTIDENDKRVYYNNAVMDLYGIPVIYTPYFSHPTPDAPNESGLLQPEYFHSTQLGNVVKEPVYYTFAPNLDMTLTPWYMSNEEPLLEGEFRGLWKEGSFYLRGAAADAYNRDDSGDKIPGDWFRGFVEAHGKLQLNDHWDMGLDAEHASDDTVLQYYSIGYQELLTSRLYAERIEGRNYFDIESLAFQDLDVAAQRSVSPYILPQANFHYESDPLEAHSRIQFDSNALVLERETGDTDQRVSSTLAWKLPYITHGGQVFELSTSMRGDAYHVSDQVVDPSTGRTFNGDTGRFIPEADFDWRYPFITRLGDGKSLMIAPIVEVAASPNLHQASNIPNEDSQLAELSDINLFSPNRFAGLDEVESGLRGTYGTRGELQLADQKYLQWLFGQTYQENDSSPFPLTSTENAHSSDYIGHVGLKYDAFDIAYSFRLDRDSLSPTSNEVGISYGQKPFFVNLNYLSLQNEPLFGDRKEVSGNTAIDLTPEWTFNVSGTRDLGSNEGTTSPAAILTAQQQQQAALLNPLEASTGTVGFGTSLVFHNECIAVTTMANRSYITVEDVKPTTTFGVTIVFKNFGQTGTPVNSASLGEAGTNTGLTSVNTINSGQNPVNAGTATGYTSSKAESYVNGSGN